MEKCKVYESGVLASLTGDALRPGGLELTRRAVDCCRFAADARLLDLGCGKGATVEYLTAQHGLQCIGLDKSILLIEQGLARNPVLQLRVGDGEKIPFPADSFDGVLAECSFSLMQDKNAVLDEVVRVMIPGGRLIISDMYLRAGRLPEVSSGLAVESCVLNAILLEELEIALIKKGFGIMLREDYTTRLKELMATIIMEHGSLQHFWELVAGKSPDCSGPPLRTTGVKLGYFLLIAVLKEK